MKKTIWAIEKALYESEELEKLLHEEWEPFDITEFSRQYIVWLRKIIKVEAI